MKKGKAADDDDGVKIHDSNIKDAERGNKMIGVVAQKDFDIEIPEINDLHDVGTVASILKMLKMPDGNTTVIIQGKKRFKIKSIVKTDPYIQATVDPVSDEILKKYPNNIVMPSSGI